MTSAAAFDFSQYRPEAASAEFAQFTQNLRELQDVMQSANPDAAVWAAAAVQLSQLSATLAQHRAPEMHAPRQPFRHAQCVLEHVDGVALGTWA